MDLVRSDIHLADVFGVDTVVVKLVLVMTIPKSYPVEMTAVNGFNLV